MIGDQAVGPVAVQVGSRRRKAGGIQPVPIQMQPFEPQIVSPNRRPGSAGRAGREVGDGRGRLEAEHGVDPVARQRADPLGTRPDLRPGRPACPRSDTRAKHHAGSPSRSWQRSRMWTPRTIRSSPPPRRSSLPRPRSSSTSPIAPSAISALTRSYRGL